MDPAKGFDFFCINAISAACLCSKPYISEGSKGKGKYVVVADDDFEDEDDIDEHMAFLLRRFSKLKFKRKLGAFKPYKKDYQSNNKLLINPSLNALIVE